MRELLINKPGLSLLWRSQARKGFHRRAQLTSDSPERQTREMTSDGTWLRCRPCLHTQIVIVFREMDHGGCISGWYADIRHPDTTPEAGNISWRHHSPDVRLSDVATHPHIWPSSPITSNKFAHHVVCSMVMFTENIWCLDGWLKQHSNLFWPCQCNSLQLSEKSKIIHYFMKLMRIAKTQIVVC